MWVVVVLMVVLFYGIIWFDDMLLIGWENFVYMGVVGVDLFFVISGFIMWVISE